MTCRSASTKRTTTISRAAPANINAKGVTMFNLFWLCVLCACWPHNPCAQSLQRNVYRLRGLIAYNDFWDLDSGHTLVVNDFKRVYRVESSLWCRCVCFRHYRPPFCCWLYIILLLAGIVKTGAFSPFGGWLCRFLCFYDGSFHHKRFPLVPFNKRFFKIIFGFYNKA